MLKSINSIIAIIVVTAFAAIPAQASFMGMDSMGTVNGSELSKSKFENGYKKLEKAYKEKGLDLSKAENASSSRKLKQDILKSMVQYALVINEANSRGIKVTDDEVNKQISFIKDKMKAGGQDYEKALKEQGLTEKDLKVQLKDEFLIKKLEQAFLDEEPQITKAEVEKFYNSPDNAKYFNHGELAHAAHILIMADSKKLSEKEMNAKKELAQGLLNKALKGEDFGNLAINNSEDPGSKGNGGDLGYFPKGNMVPEFEKACFEGKIGAIYPELVKTTYGYHIIKVIDRKPAGKTPLDETLSKQIAQAIRANKAKMAMDMWLKSASLKVKVELKPEYKEFYPQK